ncbi:MAG: DMT family transporter [Paracoccaceae bacterium]
MKIESRNLDTFGIAGLCFFSLISGYNQVIMKVVNDGLQPVFCAGLRSLVAAFLILLWLLLTKKSVKVEKSLLPAILFYGMIFGAEFMFLYIALDLTSVIRVTIMFYTMPIWLALMNHFLLKNDKLSIGKTVGLFAAVAGVIISVSSSTTVGGLKASITGDICALLGSIGWAYFAFYSKNSRVNTQSPDTLMFYAFLVSGPMLLILSIFYGDFIRDFTLLHYAGFTFQVLFASIGFIFWIWLFKRYSATTVASFSFLTPIMGIFFGWLLLSEQLSNALFVAGLLVTGGIYLVTKAETKLAG